MISASKIAEPPPRPAIGPTTDGARNIPENELARRLDARVQSALLVAAAIVIPALAARLVAVWREPMDNDWTTSVLILIAEMIVALAVALGFYFRRLPLAAAQPATAMLALYMIFGACVVIVREEVRWPGVAVVIVILGAGNVLLSWRWLGIVAFGGIAGLIFSVASLDALTLAQSVEVFSWCFLFTSIAAAAQYGRLGVYRRIAILRWRDEQSRRELTELVARLQHEVQERRSAENLVRIKEEQLRQLTHRLLTIQESERARISRELHDELGQILSAINMQLMAARTMSASEEQIDRLDECVEMVREGIQQVRHLATELRPSVLDDFGLDTALRMVVDRMASRSNLSIEYESQDEQRRFPLEVEAACFRIAQEAITNAIRHAGASWIKVKHINDGHQLLVRVEDDGVGFDPHAVNQRPIRTLSLGLLGMKERAESHGGSISIESSKGNGAAVEVRFERPVDSPLAVGAIRS